MPDTKAPSALTLVDSGGRELYLGTPVDATPEQSGGACYFDAPLAGRHARANRELLAQVLRGAGLVTTRPSGGTGATATGTGR
jgi:D-alanyl-D-alanine dipeptidase